MAETARARGCQSVFDRVGQCLFHGFWDSREIFEVISGGDPDRWRDRRVLDIGANTSGLSLELARRGARVVALEPDPYGNTRTAVRPLLDRMIAEEGLTLELRGEGMFEAAGLGRFDSVLCLGLVYHFRDPQYVLDWLSQLDMDELIVSTQTCPGEGFELMNRRDPRLGLPAFFWEGREDPLTGWHPTHALFEAMLEWAGFHSVTGLTPRMAFPKKPKPGLTNSAYFQARKGRSIDPVAARQAYLQY